MLKFRRWPTMLVIGDEKQELCVKSERNPGEQKIFRWGSVQLHCIKILLKTLQWRDNLADDVRVSLWGSHDETQTCKQIHWRMFNACYKISQTHHKTQKRSNERHAQIWSNLIRLPRGGQGTGIPFVHNLKPTNLQVARTVVKPYESLNLVHQIRCPLQQRLAVERVLWSIHTMWILHLPYPRVV